MALQKAATSNAASEPTGPVAQDAAALCEELLHHPDPVRRREAAAALRAHPGCVASMVQALRSESCREVQSALWTSLSVIGDDDVAKALIPLLQSDEASLRNGAMEVLATMPQVVSDHVDELLRHPDPDTRLLTLQLLSELQHPSIRRWLRGVLQHDDSLNVVGSAMEGMAEAGMPQDVELLRAAVQRFGNDPFLAFAADVAISRIESP
ncbi:HEAT repeat domain-containing protein [Acidovorax lacteus]|uniref:HEAT repeat domain-containing protein n=1 Tax=Acidovorax lacteus TaxID=1924988 RepID=A0ABP8L907_9BURK